MSLHKEDEPTEVEILPHVIPLDPREIKELPKSNLEEYEVEVKFDGNRVMVYIPQGDKPKILTRGKMSVTENFPEFRAGFAQIAQDHSVILDAELIMFGGKKGMGRHATSRVLSKVLPVKNPNAIPAGLTVFDIVYLDGQSLMLTPLLARKIHLSEVLTPDLAQYGIRAIEYFDGTGMEAVRDFAKKEGYEGLVIKEKDSIYPRRGGKSSHWLKYKF